MQETKLSFILDCYFVLNAELGLQNREQPKFKCLCGLVSIPAWGAPGGVSLLTPHPTPPQCRWQPQNPRGEGMLTEMRSKKAHRNSPCAQQLCAALWGPTAPMGESVKLHFHSLGQKLSHR